MWFKNLLRKLFLCMALGGHSIFGLGMSQEKIEELLHAMHETRVEMTVSEEDKAGKATLWKQKIVDRVKELFRDKHNVN
jgi:hypothetical protein